MPESKKKKNLSPEAREKLSKLAKERHAAGKFGGKEFGKLGGRPRKDRAAARVAEAAQLDENARKIIQVFEDAVDDTQPIGIRLKGAELWMGTEREEAKISIREEEKDAKQHSREELLEILSKKLTDGPAAQLIAKQLAKGDPEGAAEIIEAEVVEDEDGDRDA